MNRPDRHFFRTVRAPPQGHHMEVDRRRETPNTGFRVIRQIFHPYGLDRKSFHLNALALGVAGKRADVVDQMPSVVAPSPVAHRHRAAGDSRHDMAIERNRIGTTFIYSRCKVARTGWVALFVDLFFRAIASAGRAMTGGAGILEKFQRARFRGGVKGWSHRGLYDALAAAAIRIWIFLRLYFERFSSEGFYVIYQCPALLGRQVTPGRHRRARHAASDRIEEILVRRYSIPCR